MKFKDALILLLLMAGMCAGLQTTLEGFSDGILQDGYVLSGTFYPNGSTGIDNVGLGRRSLWYFNTSKLPSNAVISDLFFNYSTHQGSYAYNADMFGMDQVYSSSAAVMAADCANGSQYVVAQPILSANKEWSQGLGVLGTADFNITRGWFGLYMLATNESISAYGFINSSSSPNARFRPKLVVDYVTTTTGASSLSSSSSSSTSSSIWSSSSSSSSYATSSSSSSYETSIISSSEASSSSSSSHATSSSSSSSDLSQSSSSSSSSYASTTSSSSSAASSSESSSSQSSSAYSSLASSMISSFLSSTGVTTTTSTTAATTTSTTLATTSTTSTTSSTTTFPYWWPTTTAGSTTTTLCVMRLDGGEESMLMCVDGVCSRDYCFDGTRDYYIDVKYAGFNVLDTITYGRVYWLFSFVFTAFLILFALGSVLLAIFYLVSGEWKRQ